MTNAGDNFSEVDVAGDFPSPALLPDGIRRPYILYVELFAACDMSCPMCVTLPYWEGKRRMMSREMIREKLLEPAARNGVRQVLFGGGEPMLRKDALDIIADADALGLRVWLATNLLRFDDDKMRQMLSALDDPKHTIAISYDSAVPAEMNVIRGGDVFDAVDANCRRLIALRSDMQSRCELVATTTVQKENRASVKVTLDHILDTLGFDRINIGPRHDYQAVQPASLHRQQRSDWCEEHETELLAAGLLIYARARKDRRIHVVGNVDDWVRFIRAPHSIQRRCTADRIVFANAEGVVRSCMFGTAIGDFRRQSYEDILQSDGFARSRDFIAKCNICIMSCA